MKKEFNDRILRFHVLSDNSIHQIRGANKGLLGIVDRTAVRYTYAHVLSKRIVFFKYSCTALDNALSYDVASGSEITPCNKICKPLVVYRFTGNVITSITTLRT